MNLPSNSNLTGDSLPPHLKVLAITSPNRSCDWLTTAFAGDSATEVTLTVAAGTTAGMTLLRSESFDAILVIHDPSQLDALDAVEGLRTAGNEVPILVLGSLPPQEIDALCYESGADDYCCVAQTTIRGLLWKFARSLERHQLVRENRRLHHAEQQRLKQEHLEAQRLLEQQRLLIADLEKLATPNGESPRAELSFDSGIDLSAQTDACLKNLPPALVAHYRELLRTYVIMGVGNLGAELETLAESFSSADISAQQTLQMHVAVLEELVKGLGTRSARHVMNRADLLALEVISHVADNYRRRLAERSGSTSRQILPFAA